MNKIDYNGILGLPSQTVKRLTTGIDEVDWLYSNTIGDDGIAVWGLPEGKISLWAGAPGVGKSRAAKHLAVVVKIKVVKDINGNDGYFNVKYFYLEEGMQPLALIIDELRRVKYQFAVIDSINTIKEYGSGSEKNVRLIIDELRKVCEETGVHVLLLCQLAKDGEIRGSSVLLHLPDVVMRLRRGFISDENVFIPNEGNYFTLETTGKHRFGPTGSKYAVNWMHLDAGVGLASERRLNDPVWCDTHGLPEPGLEEEETEEEYVPMGIWDSFKQGLKQGYEEWWK